METPGRKLFSHSARQIFSVFLRIDTEVSMVPPHLFARSWRKRGEELDRELIEVLFVHWKQIKWRWWGNFLSATGEAKQEEGGNCKWSEEFCSRIIVNSTHNRRLTLIAKQFFYRQLSVCVVFDFLRSTHSVYLVEVEQNRKHSSGLFTRIVLTSCHWRIRECRAI